MSVCKMSPNREKMNTVNSLVLTLIVTLVLQRVVKVPSYIIYGLKLIEEPVFLVEVHARASCGLPTQAPLSPPVERLE